MDYYRIKPACFNKLLSLVEEWKSNGARLTWEQLEQGVDRLLEVEFVGVQVTPMVTIKDQPQTLGLPN